ncbi:hypoxanthine-DNA glycosylase [Elusimicrobium posterum]|uniref:DNA-deoxyinosine glycosylase n=1 Tax=Elusimicrobium posterum TaxID=3116653 RepID=UPI003C7241C2
MNTKNSFSYWAAKDAKILILGTMPGEESLAHAEYYAHARNAFWPIMFELFGGSLENASYKDKKNLILSNSIALWDVLRSCEREGSLDSDIRNMIPNDINSFLCGHPTVKAVFFNGKAAEKFYNKFFERLPGVKYFSLPSTSPANAQLNYAQKLALWADAFKKVF